MDQRLREAVFLMLMCALTLSVAAHIFVVFPFDLKISHELKEVKNPVYALVMEGVSALGDPRVGILMIVAVSAFYCVSRQLLNAGFVLATSSNFLLTSLIKVLVARPRPPDFILNPAEMFPMVNQFSFPSGHVLFFVVFFGFLAYLVHLHRNGRVRMMVIAVCAVLILLIGMSRVYLGAHWASDVLGSYVIGGLWLCLLVLLYQLASRRRNNRLKETGSPDIIQE